MALLQLLSRQGLVAPSAVRNFSPCARNSETAPGRGEVRCAMLRTSSGGARWERRDGSALCTISKANSSADALVGDNTHTFPGFRDCVRPVVRSRRATGVGRRRGGGWRRGFGPFLKNSNATFLGAWEKHTRERPPPTQTRRLGFSFNRAEILCPLRNPNKP